MLTGEKLNIPATIIEKYPVLKKIANQLEKGQANLFSTQAEGLNPSGGKTKGKE
jgi:hypothetical protein